MSWILAQNNVFNRKLSLGMYDEFLNHVNRYILSGDQSSKAYVISIFNMCHLEVITPKNDKFIKDNHFHNFFQLVLNAMLFDSLMTLCKFSGNHKKIYITEKIPVKILEKIESLSDDNLRAAGTIFDSAVTSIDKKSFDKIELLFDEITSFDAEEYTSDTCSYKYLNNMALDYELARVNNSLNFDFCADDLSKKFPFLNVRAKDYLKSVSIAIANANKKQSKKSGSKNKQVNNIPAVNTGYRALEELPLSYFQPSNDSDYGFNILRYLDLFGLHILLVAQRRKYYFDITRMVDFRGNYEVLKDFDQDKLVELHNNCVKACFEFKTSIEAYTANRSMPKAFVAYQKRNNALHNYLEFILDIFKSFDIYFIQYEANDWVTNSNFFDFFAVYNILLSLYTNSFDTSIYMLLSNRSSRAIDHIKSSDTLMIKSLNSITPMNLYQACSVYASEFDTIEDTHPTVVNFSRIVAKVLNYANEIYPTSLKLPYPLKIDNFEYQPLTSTLLDIKEMSARDEYNVLNYNKKFNAIGKDLELNIIQDNYLTVFSYLSLSLDMLNFNCLRLAYFASNFKGIGGVFNWYCPSNSEVEGNFSRYQKFFADNHLDILKEYHLHCFMLLIDILTYTGKLKELYSDNYMINLLKLTGRYDEQEEQNAKQCTIEEPILLSNDKVPALQEEFIVLAKKMINLTHYSVRQMNYFFVRNELPDANNGIISLKICASHAVNLMYLANVWLDSLVLNFDNISNETKQRLYTHGDFYEKNPLSDLFYQRLKEIMVICFNPKFNDFSKIIDSYLNYQNFESYKKQSIKLCPFVNTNDIASVELLGILTKYRLTYLDNELTKKQFTELNRYPSIANSLIMCTLQWFSTYILNVYRTLVMIFLNNICAVKSKENLFTMLDALNMLYNVIVYASDFHTVCYGVTVVRNYIACNSYYLPESLAFIANIKNLSHKLDTIAKFLAKYSKPINLIETVNHNNIINKQAKFLKELAANPIKTVSKYYLVDFDLDHPVSDFNMMVSSCAKHEDSIFSNIGWEQVGNYCNNIDYRDLFKYFFGQQEVPNLLCPECACTPNLNDKDDDDDFDDFNESKDNEDTPKYINLKEMIFDQSLVDLAKMSMKLMSQEEFAKIYGPLEFNNIDQLFSDAIVFELEEDDEYQDFVLSFDHILEDSFNKLCTEPIFLDPQELNLLAIKVNEPQAEPQAAGQAQAKAQAQASGQDQGQDQDQGQAALTPETNAQAQASSEQQLSKDNAQEASSANELSASSLGQEAPLFEGINQTQDHASALQNEASPSTDGKAALEQDNDPKAGKLRYTKLFELIEEDDLKDDNDDLEPEKVIDYEALKAQAQKESMINNLVIQTNSYKYLEVTLGALLKGIDLIKTKTLNTENIPQVMLAMALEELHKFNLGQNLHMFDDIINNFSQTICLANQANSLDKAIDAIVTLKNKCLIEQQKLHKTIESYKKDIKHA